MEKENVACVHNGVLFNQKEEQNHVIFSEMDGC
jgi:hypothetical protein